MVRLGMNMTPTKCIFCDNEANSDEHLWPDWVHEFIKKNGIQLGGLRVQIGNEPEVIEFDLEKKMDTVCHNCNNTWMSQFEQKNRPRFLKMLQKEPFSLDPGGMKIITEWAVLKSMILESEKPQHGNEPFYTREERIAFREHHQIPARTRVWVGALDEFHIGGHTTDFTIKVDGGKTRVGTGCVNTIYMGYFVCQVVTEHFFPDIQTDQIPPINPPPGISDSRLLQIYPPAVKKADWPPAPFTNGGSNGIGYLMQRWRQGEKVAMVTKDSVVKLQDPADTPSDKDQPPETFVKRTGREIDDLRAVFRKSWLLGLCIVLALGVYAAYDSGMFKKKDDPKNTSADIVKLANQYIELNAKYQKLQQDVQQKSDAEKEQEIAQLKQKIADQQREINSKAQSIGNVMVPDPKAYGGQRLVPASAIDAWTACVQSSSSVSATYGTFAIGGSFSESSNTCNALLQKNTAP
jgi:hypothetical protein